MNKKSLALKGKSIVDDVTNKIREYENKGEIELPPNYSLANAMKSALLTLQETKDKKGNLVLNSCSRSSIANSLLSMAIQGLSTLRDQCYFIPFGKKLVCQRSYFGNITLVKQLPGVVDVIAQVIYKGDTFDYEVKNGTITIKEHEQSFENKQKGELAGAYATVVFSNDRPNKTAVMTLKQLKESWKQGQTYKEGAGSTHERFGEEFSKKTIINRVTKTLINSSDDSRLISIRESINRSETIQTEQKMEEEIEKKANKEVIDVGEDQGKKEVKEEEDKVEEPEEEREQPEEEKADEDLTGENSEEENNPLWFGN